MGALAIACTKGLMYPEALIRETEKPAAHRQKGEGMNTGWREGPNPAVHRLCEEILGTPVFWVINTLVFLLLFP